MENLQAQIKTLNSQLATQLPMQILEAFQTSITEQQFTFTEKNILKVGDTFPDFNLLNNHNKTLNIKDIPTSEKLIIAFFRGSWCPYCNLELQALETVLPEIHSKNARLIAVSPQLPVYNDTLQEQRQLSFPVLTDTANQLAHQLGITFRLSDAVASHYEQLGIRLEAFNADTSSILPIPAIFVIDRDRIIRYTHIDPDYRNRVEITTLIASL